MKKISFILLSFIFSTSLFAQNIDSIYVKFYSYSDYIKSNKKEGELNRIVLDITAKLNSQLPQKYIDEAVVLLNKGQFNEASYIFILGEMRWKYYSNFFKFTTEEYDKKNEIESTINAFLRSNVRNFAAIINKASQYHLANDYIFCSRKKKPLYYDEAAGFYKRLGNQIVINEAYFANMWSKERRDFENEIK
jgi:hypothetical protein